MSVTQASPTEIKNHGGQARRVRPSLRLERYPGVEGPSSPQSPFR
jgi:hypothetical protein